MNNPFDELEKLTDIKTLRKQIEVHIHAIGTLSISWYRPEAKRHKVNVLNACLSYLDGEKNKKELYEAIEKNSKFKDSIFRSSTASLVKKVLQISNELIEFRINSIKKNILTEEGFFLKPLQYH